MEPPIRNRPPIRNTFAADRVVFRIGGFTVLSCYLGYMLVNNLKKIFFYSVGLSPVCHAPWRYYKYPIADWSAPRVTIMLEKKGQKRSMVQVYVIRWWRRGMQKRTFLA